ncbi:MAG: hydrogenase expression/formation protein HypE [Ilumatobacteraceae bacterium]|nr:hydrogenase expression/formation protein HypE [Ilumatobacteraceae bacterium]
MTGPGEVATGEVATGDDVLAWSCPVPARHDRVVMGHGGGGVLSGELVEQIILPAFGPAGAGGAPLTDAALLTLPAAAGRLAFSTDTFVVRPLEFPGGTIGDLAVHGTVNDLAMVGAQPLALSAGLVLEEGLALELLARLAHAMGRAAHAAGVPLATGDTKVVERGHGDGLYVNTAGIGVVAEGVDIGPHRAQPGDVVVLSGPVGRHGIAVLSCREGLEFGTDVRSDTAPLHRLVSAMLSAGGAGVHTLRDPTRGGLAAALGELVAAGPVGVEVEEAAVPVDDAVRAACGFLGLDPWEIANEGCLVGFVHPEVADAVVAAMRERPEGAVATVVGRVTADHPGLVVARTPLGAGRLVDRPLGEQLPRIC